MVVEVRLEPLLLVVLVLLVVVLVEVVVLVVDVVDKTRYIKIVRTR